jgi:uncharacterized protein (UPF0276 family)
MKPVGVGLVYWPGLHPLVVDGLVDVIEVEPQAYWQRNLRPHAEPYKVNISAIETIASFGLPTLIHGVAFPVGGSVPPEQSSFAPLDRCLQLLQPHWVSEHLSFNVTRALEYGQPDQPCGFLLPPRQTEAGIRQAVANIELFRAATGHPFAFETGVSYLRPRKDEIPEGEFFAQIAERAECGIVLDLHNLLANQRNGRAPVDSVLAALPLDRVWEIHLAGGCPLRNYWLDGHCDITPDEVLAVGREILPHLSSVGAIIFEVLPQYIDRIGLHRIADEIDRLRALWALRPSLPETAISKARSKCSTLTAGSAISPNNWEQALGWLVQRRPPRTPLETELATDPGVEVLTDLVFDLRCGQLCNALQLSITAMLLLNPSLPHKLIRHFVDVVPGDLFSSSEGLRFAHFARDHFPTQTIVAEVLAYETALLELQLFGSECVVNFTYDPVELLSALIAGHLPDNPDRGLFQVPVTKAAFQIP